MRCMTPRETTLRRRTSTISLANCTLLRRGAPTIRLSLSTSVPITTNLRNSVPALSSALSNPAALYPACQHIFTLESASHARTPHDLRHVPQPAPSGNALRSPRPHLGELPRRVRLHSIMPGRCGRPLSPNSGTPCSPRQHGRIAALYPACQRIFTLESAHALLPVIAGFHNHPYHRSSYHQGQHQQTGTLTDLAGPNW